MRGHLLRLRDPDAVHDLAPGQGEPWLSHRVRERLALAAPMVMAHRFVDGQPAPTLAELPQAPGVPARVLQRVVDILSQQGCW